MDDHSNPAVSEGYVLLDDTTLSLLSLAPDAVSCPLLSTDGSVSTAHRELDAYMSCMILS